MSVFETMVTKIALTLDLFSHVELILEDNSYLGLESSVIIKTSKDVWAFTFSSNHSNLIRALYTASPEYLVSRITPTLSFAVDHSCLPAELQNRTNARIRTLLKERKARFYAKDTARLAYQEILSQHHHLQSFLNRKEPLPSYHQEMIGINLLANLPTVPNPEYQEYKALICEIQSALKSAYG